MIMLIEMPEMEVHARSKDSKHIELEAVYFRKPLVGICSGVWRRILIEDGVICILGMRSINDLAIKGIGDLRTWENSICIMTLMAARTVSTRVITDERRNICMS